MKVLYIASADFKYGASKSMMSLILYMKEHYDVEPVLLTEHFNKLNEICNEHGIENYSCWYSDFMSGSPYSFFPLKIAKHIVKYIFFIISTCTQHRVLKCGLDFDAIDIVHTNHSRLQIGAYICKKKGIPHVWHIREFGREDYNVLFYRPQTINYMNANANCFVAISDAVKKVWIERGIDSAKFVTVYNGLESEGYVPKKERKDSTLKIAVVGHVQKSKGQLDIIKAIATLLPDVQSNIQLDIIGEGYSDYIHKIKKVMKENNLTNVNLLGYCNNVSEKLSEYDVGIMSSKAEGFGRVTVEYMLAGLYVIASNTGANPEIIRNDKQGMLYEFGNIKDLAKCIERVYQNKDKLCSEVENSTIFSMETYAEQIYNIYKNCYKLK